LLGISKINHKSRYRAYHFKCFLGAHSWTVEKNEILGALYEAKKLFLISKLPGSKVIGWVEDKLLWPSTPKLGHGFWKVDFLKELFLVLIDNRMSTNEKLKLEINWILILSWNFLILYLVRPKTAHYIKFGRPHWKIVWSHFFELPVWYNLHLWVHMITILLFSDEIFILLKFFKNSNWGIQ